MSVNPTKRTAFRPIIWTGDEWLKEFFLSHHFLQIWNHKQHNQAIYFSIINQQMFDMFASRAWPSWQNKFDCNPTKIVLFNIFSHGAPAVPKMAINSPRCTWLDVFTLGFAFRRCSVFLPHRFCFFNCLAFKSAYQKNMQKLPRGNLGFTSPFSPWDPAWRGMAKGMGQRHPAKRSLTFDSILRPFLGDGNC